MKGSNQHSHPFLWVLGNYFIYGSGCLIISRDTGCTAPTIEPSDSHRDCSIPRVDQIVHVYKVATRWYTVLGLRRIWEVYEGFDPFAIPVEFL